MADDMEKKGQQGNQSGQGQQGGHPDSTDKANSPASLTIRPEEG